MEESRGPVRTGFKNGNLVAKKSVLRIRMTFSGSGSDPSNFLDPDPVPDPDPSLKK